MTTTTRAESGDTPRRSMLAWALRRAAIGLVILLTAIGAFAWLLHSSIEADDEAVAVVTPTSDATLLRATPHSPKL